MRFAVHSLRLTIALTALLVLFVPAAGADEAVAQPASASARLKYLPKDYWFVGELDCRPIMKLVTSAPAQQNPQYAQFKQALQLVEQFTGIDMENDVHWLTLFAAGEKPEGLLVVQGKFDYASVAKRLTTTLGDRFKEETYKGKKLYLFSEYGLCFPEDSTLLVGAEAWLRPAIDGFGKARPLPAPLKAVLDRTPGDRVVWAAVRPKAVLDVKNLEAWRSENGKLHSMLKEIQCLSLCVDPADDGLAIKGLGHAATPAAAKRVHHYLTERKKDLLHKDGTNVVFASLLIFSELTTDGQLVEGSFRLTGTALKELWETKFVVRPEK